MCVRVDGVKCSWAGLPLFAAMAFVARVGGYTTGSIGGDSGVDRCVVNLLLHLPVSGPPCVVFVVGCAVIGAPDIAVSILINAGEGKGFTPGAGGCTGTSAGCVEDFSGLGVINSGFLVVGSRLWGHLFIGFSGVLCFSGTGWGKVPGV